MCSSLLLDHVIFLKLSREYLPYFREQFLWNIPCEPAMLSQRKLSGDPPQRPPSDFLAKSLVISAMYMKFKSFKLTNIRLNFAYIYIWLELPVV